MYAPEPAFNSALQNGRVTFGCLNSFSKVNRGALDLWGRVLVAVPGSRLVLLCGQGAHRDWALAILQTAGVDADRVEFLERRRRPRYLELYHSIDIGLDTLPWNGHVTSLDAFWMGVPVVTLVGETAVGRAGLSLAANLGMMELVSRTQGEFVSRAVSLASDLPRLAQLRATLRARFRASPLMDHTGQSRALEAVYRRVWVEWCDKRRQE